MDQWANRLHDLYLRQRKRAARLRRQPNLPHLRQSLERNRLEAEMSLLWASAPPSVPKSGRSRREPLTRDDLLACLALVVYCGVVVVLAWLA